MKHLRRLIGLSVTALVLLAALSPNAATPLRAQAATSITIEGSAIVSPILKDANQTYTAQHADTKIEVNATGTDAGFEKLCSGSLDMNMAARSISDAEIAACGNKNVRFIELLLGYDALVLVANNSSKATCITADGLNKLIGLGSDVKNWNSIDSTIGDAPISAIYAMAPTSQAYILASTLVPGEKLRGDLQTLETGAKIAEKVGTEANSIGLLSLADYNSTRYSQQAMRALQLKKDSTATCVSPDVPSLEEARYPAAETLYLYVNAASLDRPAVADFLKYLLSRDGRASVTRSLFVTASDPAYDRGQNYLNTRQAGRTFSLIQKFNLNLAPDTTGTVKLDGAAAAYPVFKAIGDAFSPRYTKITLNTVAYGNDAGYRDLCANIIDLIGTTRLPTDAEASACQKANVETLRLQLGSQGVVVVVNGNNKFGQCLTTDQLGKLFGAASEGKVKKWSDVDSSFPATDVLILTPNDGAPETDTLMSKVVKAVAPVLRKDVIQNSDALYRAAAVQNVEGGVTYMTYTEFQQVKSKVHTVAVNAGSGCVEPTDANLKNGTYPLSQSLYAVLNMTTFARPEIRAFIWYFLSDDAVAILAKQGLVGTDTAGFVAARDIALKRFEQATTSVPLATQGATAQATVVVTAAATAAVTPAATSVPPATLPGTAQATVEAPAAAPATAAPATVAPTQNATAAATAPATPVSTAAQ